MSSRDTENGEAGRKTPRTGRRAWAGRAILALVPLAILATTGHHMLHQRLEEQFRRFGQERIRAPLPEEARRLIDKGVEDAFAPVYDRIPEFLDWHYSFFGQYTELGLMLVGRLEGEIESRLLGGLEGRISAIGEDVGRVMQEEVLAELERWFDRDVASLPPGLRAAYERKLEPVLEDAKRRLTVSIGPTTVGAAMAGVGTSVGVRALATGLAERLVGGAAVPVRGFRPGSCGGVDRGCRCSGGYRHRASGAGRDAPPGRTRTGIDRIGGRAEGEGQGRAAGRRRRRRGRGAG